MLDNPVCLLQHPSSPTLTSTATIVISTRPAPPLFGGGTNNIAFLLPNADAVTMQATFWIETVQYTIQVPLTGRPAAAHHPGPDRHRRAPVPEFLITPPVAITAPRTITVTAT